MITCTYRLDTIDQPSQGITYASEYDRTEASSVTKGHVLVGTAVNILLPITSEEE